MVARRVLVAWVRDLAVAGPQVDSPGAAAPELIAGDRALAIERLGALPVFVAIAYMQPVGPARVLPVLAGFALVWELATCWLVFAVGRPRVEVFPFVFIDIGLMALAVALTGRAHSELRFVVLTTIPIISYSMPPARTLVLCATLTLAMMGPLLWAVVGGQSEAGGITVRWLLMMTFVTLFTFISVHVRDHSSSRLRALAASRQRLVSEMAQAEERERGRISQLIHDDALQLLLAAHQDLAEFEAGDAGALEDTGEHLGAGLVSLRDAIRALHPTALAGAGLPATLEHHVQRVAAGGGLEARLHIDQSARGPHDALLFAIARELVTNVAKHAHATQIEVQLTRVDGRLELTVADDGVGIADGRRDEALHSGHVGLASSVERIEAHGGLITIATAPGSGTRVQIVLPDDR